ncbi:MAG: hypothetical protein IKS99_04145 [Firmicutes bacterium]|nr:hypothetical protein [Bacillota bacterium]
MSEKYTITRYETDVPMDEFIKVYFNYEETHKLCQACPGYSGTWACPPFDFDPKDHLSQFSTFHMIVDKIDNSNATSAEEAQEWLFSELDRFNRNLLDIESHIPGSRAMAAQECQYCKKCARQSGIPCIHPELMRYSLESIGAFPVKLVHDKLGFDILWSDGESIPEYYLMVAGVLMK